MLNNNTGIKQAIFKRFSGISYEPVIVLGDLPSLNVESLLLIAEAVWIDGLTVHRAYEMVSTADDCCRVCDAIRKIIT